MSTMKHALDAHPSVGANPRAVCASCYGSNQNYWFLRRKETKNETEF